MARADTLCVLLPASVVFIEIFTHINKYIVQFVASTLIKNLKDATSQKRSASSARFQIFFSPHFQPAGREANEGEKKSYKLFPPINFNIQLSNYNDICVNN